MLVHLRGGDLPRPTLERKWYLADVNLSSTETEACLSNLELFFGELHMHLFNTSSTQSLNILLKAQPSMFVLFCSNLGPFGQFGPLQDRVW